MKWNLRILLLIVIYVTFSFTVVADINNTSSNASVVTPVNSNACSNCHNANLKPSGVNAGACGSCHVSPHFDTEPSRYNDLPKHSIHSEHTAVKQGSCQACHSQPACNRCHAGHSYKRAINCTECHGVIPSPFGHLNERGNFLGGKHNWMKCKNCHFSSEQFNFREYKYSFNESYKLCSICHSMQTKDHFQDEVNCVNCHNPHSTSLTEQTQIKIPDVTIGITGIIMTVYNLILDNFVIIAVLIIFLVALFAEQLFKQEEVKK